MTIPQDTMSMFPTPPPEVMQKARIQIIQRLEKISQAFGPNSDTRPFIIGILTASEIAYSLHEQTLEHYNFLMGVGEIEKANLLKQTTLGTMATVSLLAHIVNENLPEQP